MIDNPHYFQENFHMSERQFSYLFDLLKDKLNPARNTRPNDFISPKEKLCITLEFLCSGSLQRHVASIYRISKQRIGVIIEETCKHIVDVLKHNYVKELSQIDWMEVGNRYNLVWNLPNCLGSIDGKHVEIKCPPNGASLYYNYKGYHSIILMAVVDADYKFLYTDIGAYGSECDSTVFKNSEFSKRLERHQLNIPLDARISGNPVPYFFVADDAFPLNKNIMKPYKPTKRCPTLTIEERIFNYRLSRARRCVENAFGIMTIRFACLSWTLNLKPDRAVIITAACCALHNMLIKEASTAYCPAGFSDHIDGSGNIVEGNWRSVQITSNVSSNVETNNGRPNETARKYRDFLKLYLNSQQGSVKWQNDAIFN